jgi:hypothetical protein
MISFHDDDTIAIDLRKLKPITRRLPVKWKFFGMLAIAFLAWWFIALYFGDTTESIAAAGVGMWFAYRSIMCVSKAEDWEQ